MDSRTHASVEGQVDIPWKVPWGYGMGWTIPCNPMIPGQFTAFLDSPRQIENWEYLLLSNWSERDTIRGGQLKIGYMFCGMIRQSPRCYHNKPLVTLSTIHDYIVTNYHLSWSIDSHWMLCIYVCVCVITSLTSGLKTVSKWELRALRYNWKTITLYITWCQRLDSAE